MHIHESNARKSKFAFTIKMSEDVLSAGPKLTAIHNVIKDIPESPETWWKEYRNGMGTYSLHLYVNDENIYNQIKSVLMEYT